MPGMAADTAMLASKQLLGLKHPHDVKRKLKFIGVIDSILDDDVGAKMYENVKGNVCCNDWCCPHFHPCRTEQPLIDSDMFDKIKVAVPCIRVRFGEQDGRILLQLAQPQTSWAFSFNSQYGLKVKLEGYQIDDNMFCFEIIQTCHSFVEGTSVIKQKKIDRDS